MNMAAILRSITTSTSRYEERADGVIVQRLLTTRTQTLMDARENTSALVRMTGGHLRPVLIDIRIVRALQAGVREHYADPDLACGCFAVALLVATPSGHQLGRYFMAQNTRPLPMSMFNDEAPASAWLHQQVSDQPTMTGSASL